MGLVQRVAPFLYQYDIASFSNRVTYEMLYVERALDFLKLGGILGVLLPDTLLSSPVYARARAWILQVALPRAIMSSLRNTRHYKRVIEGTSGKPCSLAN